MKTFPIAFLSILLTASLVLNYYSIRSINYHREQYDELYFGVVLPLRGENAVLMDEVSRLYRLVYGNLVQQQ